MRVNTFLKAGNDLWLNPQRKFAGSCMLVPASAQIPITTPAQSGSNPGRSSPIIFEGAQNSLTELFALTGVHGASDASAVQNRLTVEFDDLAYHRRLMNRDVLANHVFGNNVRPLPLRETLVLESQQNLVARLLNNSTAGESSFAMSAKCFKLESSEVTMKLARDFAKRTRIRKSFLYPYWFTTDSAVSLAANGTLRVFCSNRLDTHLTLFYLMASFISAGAEGDTTEGFSAIIYDAGTRRPLMPQAVTSTMLGGSAQLPYVFPWPLTVRPNQQIQIDLTNLITDATTDVFLTFHGVAMYTGTPLWDQKSAAEAVPVLAREEAN